MPIESPNPPSRRARFAIAVLAIAALLPSCDNPACIFGGNCTGTSGSSGDAPNAASSPSNHAWIVAGAPHVTDFFPSGNSISTSTPIVVVFNESLSTASIQGAFALVAGAPGAPPVPIPIAAPTLVSDGRVLIIAPLIALTAGAPYSLKYTEMANPTDLQGFSIQIPTDHVVGSFTVAATNPATPRVVMSFPPDNATGQGTTAEFIVAFDRKIDSTTVTLSSFAVQVNGATPANNVLAQPVLLIGSGGIPSPETRVFRYRASDNGEPVPLPTSAMFKVTMSPANHLIKGEDMTVLAQTIIDYQTAAIGEPVSAEITSLPDDAIGIDNLNGTTPLAVGVQLIGAQANDTLDMFVFGPSTDTVMPRTISLARSVRLGDVPSFDVALQTVTIGEPQLDLASGSSPVTGRFADGNLTIALSLRRSSTSTAVRLLDVDQVASGVQSARFDVTRPTLTGFGTSGTNTTSFRSNSNNLVVVGRANEQLGAVEVVAGAANNGMLAKVVASSSSGLFIAQPVALGVVDPAQLPLPFQVTLYDRAMNRATAAINATFTQLGAVGPGAALPGAGTISIEAFDERTLAAVASARVYVHEDLAGVVSLVDSGVTAANGFATLTAATGESVVTVEATGYDLFTFYGLPSNRISVPLTRSNAQPGTLQGAMSTSSASLPQFDRFVADTRTFEADDPDITVQSCTLNPQTLTAQCAFGPRFLRLGVLGGLGFVAIDPATSALNFSAQSFLRGYSLQVPLAPVSSPNNLTSTVSFSVNQPLDDANTPAEERAIDGPTALLDASAASGLDLNDLDGDPRVAIEARVPGLNGTVLAGFGAALDPQGSPASLWVVRSALPGIADPFDDDGAGTNDELGRLVTDGTIEDELFLRAELRDGSGAQCGQRVRFTQTPLVPLMIDVPAAPRVTSPTSNSTTAGSAYQIDFDDVITDASGLGGLYRVTLVSSSGRAWVLYRLDQTGATTANVELPDLAAIGGSPLPSGSITCSVSAFAWASFAPTPLSLTDVEREHELFATCAPITFSQP